jgi:hypothetical protein
MFDTIFFLVLLKSVVPTLSYYEVSVLLKTHRSGIHVLATFGYTDCLWMSMEPYNTGQFTIHTGTHASFLNILRLDFNVYFDSLLEGSINYPKRQGLDKHYYKYQTTACQFRFGLVCSGYCSLYCVFYTVIRS